MEQIRFCFRYYQCKRSFVFKHKRQDKPNLPLLKRRIIMKKSISIILVSLLLVTCFLPAFASGPVSYAPILTSLVHNCPNTGIMLPAQFDPYVNTYLLTVADWVSRVTFTPTAQDPSAYITVNGVPVENGTKSPIINMSDKPQQVIISVSNTYGDKTNYTIYLQRRPSEKRTKSSAGYLKEFTYKDGRWYTNADLGTVKYYKGNLSTFTNNGNDSYRYVANDNCLFYTGTASNPKRCADGHEFRARMHETPNMLFRFIYIESEVAAIIPYQAD